MKTIVIENTSSRIPEFRIYDRSKIKKTTVSSNAGDSYPLDSYSEGENMVSTNKISITVLGDLIIKRSDNKPTNWRLAGKGESKAILGSYQDFIVDPKKANRIKFDALRDYVSVEPKLKRNYDVEVFFEKVRGEYPRLDGNVYGDVLILKSNFQKFLDDYKVKHFAFYDEVSVEYEEVSRIDRMLSRKIKIRAALKK
jgi:hypothetical protein